MRRTRRLHSSLAALVFVTIAVAAPKTADAVLVFYPGASCQDGGYPAALTWNYVDGSAVSVDTATVGAMAVCPATATTATTGTALLQWVVYFQDNSTYEGSGGAEEIFGTVACTPYARNTAGSIYSAPQRHSCGTSGGCTGTSYNASYTGTSYLLWEDPFTASSAHAFWAACYVPNDYSRVYLHRLQW